MCYNIKKHWLAKPGVQTKQLPVKKKRDYHWNDIGITDNNIKSSCHTFSYSQTKFIYIFTHSTRRKAKRNIILYDKALDWEYWIPPILTSSVLMTSEPAATRSVTILGYPCMTNLTLPISAGIEIRTQVNWRRPSLTTN